MVRLTDRPNMTIAVYWDLKQQTNQPINKSKQAKIRNRYNQAPHMTWESDKTQRKPRGYSFSSRWSQGCKEQTRKRDEQGLKITKMIHKISTALERSYFIGGLNVVSRRQPHPQLDVDEDTKMFGLLERSIVCCFLIM